MRDVWYARSHDAHVYGTTRSAVASSQRGDVCPICLEELRQLDRTQVKLRCTHVLHEDCAEELLQRNDAHCPNSAVLTNCGG